jgi:hypothetical protein
MSTRKFNKLMRLSQEALWALKAGDRIEQENRIIDLQCELCTSGVRKK